MKTYFKALGLLVLLIGLLAPLRSTAATTGQAPVSEVVTRWPLPPARARFDCV